LHFVRSRLQPSGDGRADDQEDNLVRRLVRQPLIEVFGLFLVAGAAKGGYGALAVGGMLTFLPLYFGALATVTAIRNWRHEAAACRCPTR
jgi:hypothetical protein